MLSLLSKPARQLTVAFAITAATVTGLTFYQGGARAQTEAGTPPPPTVMVTQLEQQQIRTWASFSGRLAPVASAQIKPLVGGTIQQVNFHDGQQVERGQALFLIDPRPHQAALARAEAQLTAAQSRLALARHELERARQLLTDKLISQSLFDAARNEAQIAEAAVAEAQASSLQAELNLEYAHISAPVSGRISRAELTVGNVVEAGPNAPILASIVANDRLYAEFDVDEQTFIHFVRATEDPQTMPVELTLASDKSVIYEGKLHAFDNRLNTETGTIRARAIFENIDGALTTGMFAEVRLGAPQLSQALIVPERAIGTNQNKKFVLVVDADNTARYREVNLGKQWRGQRIIDGGLNAGDRVIVGGLSHVRPDTPVTPQPAAPANSVAASL
ncbi:efflux RND transporter periplasmic adaptor subunit [Gilvimarinus sp. SDUM040013]|uniref:Efflux RND transporter periplasmic adaptor subunit n=1 Tax=Gilvimarinus gilvus TaxID=3058038 RepID=A0ABU4RXE0_9GAMM|nr:efflux RND transporter periplasmic adaptor subunit [Gilvimarinus sp. SDUM040013]MDO3386752.1 efflux RND transporter periplasmic adaptor subunit [Gilvimarinus sp. SDUM040013]MDX6848318.1 efflux RND transporter periplasmic adaptor subunit [Gilvimarinus sp. SDUM040013]